MRWKLSLFSFFMFCMCNRPVNSYLSSLSMLVATDEINKGFTLSGSLFFGIVVPLGLN